jgi:hypothetical protein
MEHLFIAAATQPPTAAAATSPTAAATRGYSPPHTENFAALIGTIGATNDIVAKYRVGPLNSAQTTPWPPDAAAPGFKAVSVIKWCCWTCADGVCSRIVGVLVAVIVVVLVVCVCVFGRREGGVFLA